MKKGLLKHLTKLMLERALEAELSEHLGHDKHGSVSNDMDNTRNGKSRKTLKGEFGELPIKIPRDGHGSFEPKLVSKHQTRWAGFDMKTAFNHFSLLPQATVLKQRRLTPPDQSIHTVHVPEKDGTELGSSMKVTANEPQCGYFFVRLSRHVYSTAGLGREAFGLADGRCFLGTSHFVMHPPPHWEVRYGSLVQLMEAM